MSKRRYVRANMPEGLKRAIRNNEFIEAVMNETDEELEKRIEEIKRMFINAGREEELKDLPKKGELSLFSSIFGSESVIDAVILDEQEEEPDEYMGECKNADEELGWSIGISGWDGSL